MGIFFDPQDTNMKLKQLTEMFTSSSLGASPGIPDLDNRFGGTPFEGMYFDKENKTDAVKHVKKFHKKDGPLKVAGLDFVMDKKKVDLEEPAQDREEETKEEVRDDAGIDFDVDKNGAYKGLLKRLKKVHNT